VKNRFIINALSLFNRFRKKRVLYPAEKSFLVVSTTGLGDTLWATPAIRCLRESFPKSYLAVLTSPVGFEVLKKNPHIDELFVVKNSSLSFLKVFFRLRTKKIETALLFHASQRLALPLCAFLFIPDIIGTKGCSKGLDALLTAALEQKEEHEIARRLSLVQRAGATLSSLSLEMAWDKEDEKRAEGFLESHRIPSFLPLVGLHPGAKDRFKRLPPALFVRLGQELKERLGCQIFVTGSLSERSLIETVSSQIEGAIPLTLPISVFSALLSRFALFITNDTGPMHLAVAAKTPTLALFSPTDPKRCGPYHAPRSRVLYRPATCFPCLKKKCQEPFCLLQIPFQTIVNEALELYAR